MKKFFNRILSRRRRPQRPRYVGRRSRRSYEEHARSPEVQNRINSARRSWRERYGVDPAAGRIERARKGK
jgi:hypothetical protein